VGVLVVIKQRSFSEKDIARLQVFANLAAISLRRAMILEQLEQQREELQKALQSREELLRILAHDLRNPVNTIAIAASELLNDPTQTELPKLHEIIDRSTKRIDRMIHDLLEQAIIERTGSLPINLQPHPAHSLAEEACEITRVQAKARTVRVECHNCGSAVIHVDRDRLLQVLTNLIDNALKFTPKGGCITIESEVREDHARYSVSNTGPAIPEAFREKVFEPYFQVPGTAHRGSGLGLAIAKHIVEQHGGTIWFEAADGERTTFTFTVPADPLAA
jgi:signal transduction histidine kinase